MATASEGHLKLLAPKGKPVIVELLRAEVSINGTGSKHRIPYYNILWAEVTNNSLTIDYVSDPTKATVKLEQEKLSVPENRNIERVEQLATDIMARAYGESKLRKRAYVLVNPHSGPGGGRKKWEASVRPLFEAARMELDVVILERGGQATDLAEHVDIDRYDTIVACSGDGTPHEIFNGLAKRPDAKKALTKMPVSHIPCGSGNALSLNLYGSNKPSTAAVGIIKGIEMPLDLVSITQDDERFVSFLSQAVGIIAESDLATENLRWMGAKRFELGLVMRVFQKKCYPCDLMVKVEVADKAGVKAYYRQKVQGDAKGSSNEQVVNGDQTSEEGGLPNLKYGTIKDDKETLEDWETIPGDKIGNFYCGNLAYMSPDANFFPGTLPSDGCMDLVTINGDLPTVQATKTLLAVESGKFFDLPQVNYKKISAYRITPRDQPDGYISIDGERVPFKPFQAEVHQGLGRVLSKDGKLQAEGPLGWQNDPSQTPADSNVRTEGSGQRKAEAIQ